jgi:ATP-binding cassette subfamily B protein
VKTFRRLLGFLRPYRSGVIWSFVLALLAMLGTVAIPYLTGQAIDAIRDGDQDALVTLGIGIAVAGLARMGLTIARRLVAGRVSLGIEIDLREQVYGRLQSLELAWFDRQQTGQLMSRATVDLQSVRFFLGYGLVFLTQSGLTIILAAAAMLLIEPGLALIALAPVPFVVLISQRYGKQSRPALQEVQQRLGELTAEAEENISGVRVVKSFAREARQYARFERTVGRVFAQSMVTTRQRAFYNPFIGFLPQLGLAALLLVGGNRVIDGSLELGDFTTFYIYLLYLLGPMRSLGFTLGLAQRATASGARLFEVLDTRPSIVAPPGAPPLPPGNGRVELRGVTVEYEGAARPALADVSLDVEGGTTIALVGATGSGKTTLVQLLPRLYDPTHGTVTIDGADVRTVDLDSLRHAIAVVNDDPFLFSDTVHANIAYARADATRPRSRPPPAAPRPTTSSSGCPRATTRRSASGA